jgi:hypothetical protein
MAPEGFVSEGGEKLPENILEGFGLPASLLFGHFPFPGSQIGEYPRSGEKYSDDQGEVKIPEVIASDHGENYAGNHRAHQGADLGKYHPDAHHLRTLGVFLQHLRRQRVVWDHHHGKDRIEQHVRQQIVQELGGAGEGRVEPEKDEGKGDRNDSQQKINPSASEAAARLIGNNAHHRIRDCVPYLPEGYDQTGHRRVYPHVCGEKQQKVGPDDNKGSPAVNVPGAIGEHVPESDFS